MSLTKNTFEGDFTNDAQIDNVPIQLLSFVSMLVDGINITNKGFSQAALTGLPHNFLFRSLGHFRIFWEKICNFLGFVAKLAD